ncbi:MAG: hypothetical protein M3Y27_03220, partial [Acidobacteriota bacterium]|nr:hypothetical protein [Acidobacteriota bacterium]
MNSSTGGNTVQASRRFAALIPIVLISCFAFTDFAQAQTRKNQVTPWAPIVPAPQPQLNVPASPKLAALSTSAWTDIGPAPLNGGTNFSGRITGIAANPANSQIIYVSPAGGGVWKTINGGGAWTPQTDPQMTLSMGAIAIGSNGTTIYAGTGESNNSLDSNFGRGILVSSDAGATWTLTTGPGGVFNTRRLTASEITIDPANPLVAYAAMADFGNNGLCCTNTGIYKTSNSGSTWTNVTAAVGLDATGPWTSVQVDPNNPGTVYAAHGTAFTGSVGQAANGVYKSTDGGATWPLLPLAPNGVNTGRIVVAVAKTPLPGNQTFYVTVSNPNTFALFKIVRSDNGGTSFTDLTPGTPNYMGGQGWYDTTVIVDPTTPATVYVEGSAGANSILRSTDAGVTWTDISGGAVSPHADHHALAFDANGKLLDGDDGGIFRLETAVGPVWTDLNGNLETIQFQGIGLHP